MVPPHTAAQVVPWAELCPFLALILEIQDEKIWTDLIPLA